MSSVYPFTADSNQPTADNPDFSADGGQIPGPYGGVGSLGHITLTDHLNGSVNLAWGPAPALNVASWNVYLDGVLYTNVACLGPAFGGTATITGLQQTTYSAGAVAAASGNSSRPQNMPPNGVVTPAPSHTVYVTAVVGGIEVARTNAKTFAPGPSSIMLTTPMKRPFPFPSVIPGG